MEATIRAIVSVSRFPRRQDLARRRSRQEEAAPNIGAGWLNMGRPYRRAPLGAGVLCPARAMRYCETARGAKTSESYHSLIAARCFELQV